MSCLHCHCAFYLLIPFVAAQFPEHVDLQKIEEIRLNNEKYNILKPTVHKITDHFKDFMRREIKNKDERVFIDDNGFRHFWSGFPSKQSLRKTDVLVNESNKNIDVNNKTDAENTTQIGEELNTTNKTNSDEKPEEIKVDDETMSMRANETEVPTTENNVTEKPNLRQAATTKPAAGGKTVAVTTFFCPFFGVIKMTTFLE